MEKTIAATGIGRYVVDAGMGDCVVTDPPASWPDRRRMAMPPCNRRGRDNLELSRVVAGGAP
jgi:hypothetical protein